MTPPWGAWFLAALIILAIIGLVGIERVSKGRPTETWTKALQTGLIMLIGSLGVALLRLISRSPE